MLCLPVFFYKAAVLQFGTVNHIKVISSYQILYKNISFLWFEIRMPFPLFFLSAPHPQKYCEMATFHTEEKASKCKIDFTDA